MGVLIIFHLNLIICIGCVLFSSDTSRPQRPAETNGKDYYFVTRDKMEEEIQAGKFIEFGEYKGNLYGTASESVRSIINTGFVCVLNPHSQALKMLRTCEFKPYIIFIKPPEFEVLKQSRHNAYAKSTFDESNSRAFNVRISVIFSKTKTKPFYLNYSINYFIIVHLYCCC